MIPKIKKYLCRNHSIYGRGKLVVPGYKVFTITVVWFITIVFVAYLVLNLLIDLIERPVYVIASLVMGAFVVAILSGAVLVLIYSTPIVRILNYIGKKIDYIGKKIELTCDRVVFPESVTGIYAEIESLSDDDRDKFFVGLRPLIRKLNIEDKL